MDKEIKIPFGAKDSELKGWEYTIPENMEAEIKDGKIIVKQKESDDEIVRKEIISFIKEFEKDHYRCIDFSSWIAFLERQGPVQNKEEREYVRTLKSLIADFLHDKEDVNRGYYQDIYDWLDGRHIEQKPAEWSEEDEETIARICANLKYLIKEAGCDSKLKEKLEERIKWTKRLKPLRDNYKKCNSHWKPSEEQMKALQSAIVFVEIRKASDYDISPLKELYEQLKKL